jgi:DNA-binding GntR family transcriptional regulator
MWNVLYIIYKSMWKNALFTRGHDDMASPKYQTRTWHVYHDIVRLISIGEIPAGTRLDEQLIANQLGVSRTPLREAITRLVQDGLVENRPYRGNFVRSFTAKEVFDLYEVRKGLESMAVRVAIPNLTEDAITHLRTVLGEIDTALQASDLDTYGLADQQFHEAIAQLSGNSTLITMLNQLGGQIQLIRTMANQDPAVVEITAMERPEIVDAMEEGDVDRAAHLMEEHIELVQRYTTSRFDPVPSQIAE